MIVCESPARGAESTISTGCGADTESTLISTTCSSRSPNLAVSAPNVAAAPKPVRSSLSSACPRGRLRPVRRLPAVTELNRQDCQHAQAQSRRANRICSRVAEHYRLDLAVAAFAVACKLWPDTETTIRKRAPVTVGGIDRSNELSSMAFNLPGSNRCLAVGIEFGRNSLPLLAHRPSASWRPDGQDRRGRGRAGSHRIGGRRAQRR